MTELLRHQKEMHQIIKHGTGEQQQRLKIAAIVAFPLLRFRRTRNQTSNPFVDDGYICSAGKLPGNMASPPPLAATYSVKQSLLWNKSCSNPQL
ncbi:hypothetical protein TNCT_87331 [Trichonephila clavata]|uniref:Uncharacterized protein n=1 Tax=Trichonephila clavata TaxID=2740835 RepID=A0A8X6GN81_TRICU|nr:hypothetical protein TNCT_87331 [Trichonephila clavata]